MADGTELTRDTANPVPTAPAEPALSLGDERAGNGPASAPARADVARDPSPALTEQPGTAPSSLAAAVLQELEERVRSLEEKYAALQDTGVIEERVVQRLNVRLRRKPVTEI